MGVGVETSSKEDGEVMDTPERSKNHQIATSISKFEDSPVFNFLNNLSPIKPVKSAHISQTINPLSFSSIPSVFTSPHVTSLKESRFLRRHQISDPSKPEFSSDDRGIVDTKKANVEATKKLDELQENVYRRESDGEVACQSSYDCSKYIVDFAGDYDFNSPTSGLRPNCGLKDKHVSDYVCSSKQVPFVQNMEGVSPIDQNKEDKSCDWDSLISDATDLLIFESPNDTDSYKKSIDLGMSFYTSINNDMQNMQSLCAEGSVEQSVEGNEPENLSTQPGEGIEIIDNYETRDIVGGPSMENPGEKMDCEHLNGLYRGMRRRCLVFEMSGARRKHLTQNSDSDSSALMKSDGSTSSNGQKLNPIKTGNESTRVVLPGIGLHLNALAATPKDYKIVNHDSSSASGRLLIGSSSSVSFNPSTIDEQDLSNNVLPASSSEREVGGSENTVLPLEDACEASGYIANEEMSHSSPKKKRRRVEQAVEVEACKRCNCKKSKCLKLYCECFAAGVYCVEPCACIDCFNKPVHEDTVLATRKQIESRNPLAFAPKVIKGPDSLIETGDDSSKTPASARHKRGCNCKKSGCLKKYCECYQGGVGCSINCRCEGCKNAFGRKDGCGVICMEAEAEDDETETTEKNLPDRSFRKIVIENDPDSSSLPSTPLQSVRKSVQLPLSSKNKPPRSTFLSIGSSSGFQARQGFIRPSFAIPPPKFDDNKNLETVREEDDEIPDFLSSPIGGIKSSSPNGKRVSPPHGAGASSSPGLRSSRKLILQSIPSFPSLSSNQ